MLPRVHRTLRTTATREGWMKTLVAAGAAAAVSLLGADVAHAVGPDYFHLNVKWWILIIVVLLILNLVCCWWRKR
jgi:hypothetical protein